MAESIVTPLQLTAGVGFYSGNAITANTQLANTIAAYSAVLTGNLLTVIAAAAGNVSLGITAGTLANLKTLGANVSGNYCPALGDSVPSNVALTVGNAGFTGAITSSASTYLGSGDFGKFAQAFGAAQGYISLTNQIILSAVNSNGNNWVGQTFTNMNDLITAGITRVTSNLAAFGADLAATGELIDFTAVENFGTPAAVLQQLARAGNMTNGTLPCVQTKLRETGLSDQNIADLVNNNRSSLYNQVADNAAPLQTISRLRNANLPRSAVSFTPSRPGALTENEFDSLQRLAYQGMCNVAGACLQEVLDTMNITTPNITTMCELMDPVKIFPNSYSTLTLPTPSGLTPIYDSQGDVNSIIEPTLNSGTVVVVGCDQMAKIMPSAQAAANRALQIALQQINGLRNTTPAALAGILQ
jgi:hypothetical protein